MKNQDRNIRPDSFKHLQHGYNREILIYNSRNLIVFIDDKDTVGGKWIYNSRNLIVFIDYTFSTWQAEIYNSRNLIVFIDRFKNEYVTSSTIVEI